MRVPLGSLLLLGTITLGAGHALAADGKPAPFPPCTTTPTPADQKGAKGAFDAGQASYLEADYGTAVTYWRDAYRRDCTAHAMLLNLARAYEAKGDRAEAINALETYLQRKPDDPNADQIQRRIQNLKAQMAAAAPPPLPPQAAPPPPVAVVQPVAAPAAPVAPAEPASASSGKRSIGPIIVASAGGVIAVVGAVVMAGGAKKIQDAEATCPSRQCPVVQPTDPRAAQIAQAKDDGNAGRAEVTKGAVLAGVGIALGVGGLIWYFAMPKASTGTPAANKATFTPAVAPGFAGVSFGGTF
jgi:tetratricopeptide (TPR) repeat protein